MWFKQNLASAALVASAAAQFVSHTETGYGISVNIPSDTASSKSGPIYFQISAPSGTQWAAFGQGTKMSGSTMFVIYASGSDVVLSPRTASGHNMPTYSSSIEATLQSGSGVQSDGSMVANVRCDNCLGSMDPTSTDSDWIMAYKTGDSLDSSSQSATIQQHDSHSQFTLDLTTGTGGTDPFAAAGASSSASTSTASATGTASGTATTSASGTATTTQGSQSTSSSSTATSTKSVSSPIASSNPNSSSDSTSKSESNTPTNSPFAHGVLMSILFVGLFPLFAMTMYLPTTKKVRFIHAPLQMISVILLIVGMALGIVYGNTIDELSGYHQIIGFIVVALMVLVQPAMGIYQHLHYHKTGGRSPAGPAHQWLGRATIALGIVNGGLGWNLTATKSAYAPYAALSVVMFVIYVAVIAFSTFRNKSQASRPYDENDKSRGYEMHNAKQAFGAVQETNTRA